MSNRANGGMMSVVGQHKSLQELEQSLMIPNDPNAPNAAAASVETPDEQRTEEATVVPGSLGGRGREVVRKKKAGSEAAVAPVDEILAEFVPETRMEVLHTRIPAWLNEALKDKLGPLERANPKVTKQALVTFCLIKALGVTPPPDFRLW
jgi:hypothetical protein